MSVILDYLSGHLRLFVRSFGILWWLFKHSSARICLVWESEIVKANFVGNLRSIHRHSAGWVLASLIYYKSSIATSTLLLESARIHWEPFGLTVRAKFALGKDGDTISVDHQRRTLASEFASTSAGENLDFLPSGVFWQIWFISQIWFIWYWIMGQYIVSLLHTNYVCIPCEYLVSTGIHKGLQCSQGILNSAG